MTDGIADEIREHAAELKRVETAPQPRRALALEPHLRAARIGRIQREAVVEQRLDLDLRHVQRHDARIEAREVEQIVDEQRHALDLNLQRREVRRGIAHAVLERLGGGAEVGERRAQVVTGGSHELALCP